MTPTLLETVEIETGPKPTASIIWMHGLGADGHDFEPVVPHVASAVKHSMRFVFPHAPMRSVTLNAGMRMRAWYDILGLEQRSVQDEIGFRASSEAISALIKRENERGIETSRTVLAGFSQGGAMSLYMAARYPQKLAGIIALSCYLPLATKFDAERLVVNQTTPIFLAHGSMDAMIDERRGVESRELLEAAGYSVEWHSYPMGHAVCGEEIAAISVFLQRVLSA